MNSAAAFAASLVAGVASGFLAASLMARGTGEPPEGSHDRNDRSPPLHVPARGPDDCAAQASIDGRAAELSELRGELAMRAARHALPAEPPPSWPEDAHPLLDPDAVAFQLARSLGAEQDTVAIECDQYPCVVAISAPVPPSGTLHDAFFKVHERLDDVGFAELERPSATAATVSIGGVERAVQAFGYTDRGDGVAELQRRVRALMDDVRAASDDGGADGSHP